jgi:cytidylate kinase
MTRRARGLTIAVDGPAGVGKSTAARALATALGYRCFETGALYRVVGLAARERGVDPSDTAALAAMLPTLRIGIEDAAGSTRVLLDGRDVTEKLREPDAGEWASRVAAVPIVRTHLLERQRAIAADGGVVMEGRDIGTVVLPDADYKFFLTADAEERARRRQAEQPGEASEATRAALATRDRRDAERATAPLKPAGDAIVVDTSRLTADEVLATLLATVRTRARP